jgi:hypothetical protein
MIKLLVTFLLLTQPTLAADLLIRASSQATASLGLFTLGLKVAPTALFPWPTGTTGTGNYPYLQGGTATGNWIAVIANGGNGALLNASAAYDTGWWFTLRWNKDISTLHLPASLIAYRINGLPVVASGAVAGASVLDTVNATPTTSTQPPAAVLLTAPSVM